MEPLQAATRTDHSETGKFYRLDGGREEIKMMSSIAERPRKLSNAKSHKPFDQFAIARAALLLCSSRSPKSCSFHVEKVIVFSLCFWPFAFIMSSSSILGDCTLEQLPGKCSPSFTVLLLCLPALPAACVAGNCIELMWRRRKLLWRRRRRMEASTKAKLQAS